MNVSNKVCVVTGGVGGLGKSIARSLLRRSALVCLVDVARDGDEVARRLAAEHGRPDRCVYVRADCTKVAELEAAYKAASAKFGGKPVKVMGIEDKVDLTIALNVTAVVHGTRIALADMSKTGGGCVVNTASVAGLWPSPMLELYSATKGAVTFLTRSLKFTAPAGVRVNALCPHVIDTPMYEHVKQDAAKSRTATLSGASMEAQKRVLTPDEVAEAGMRLIEEDLHGECLAVVPEGVFRAKVRVESRDGGPVARL